MTRATGPGRHAAEEAEPKEGEYEAEVGAGAGAELGRSAGEAARGEVQRQLHKQQRPGRIAAMSANLGEEDLAGRKEEVAPPALEGGQEEREAGGRGRARSRGRGGRGREGGGRQEARAPNCLSMCPAACRGFGSTCLAVESATRGTPAQARGRCWGGGGRGGQLGESNEGTSQRQADSSRPPSANSLDTVPVSLDLPSLEEAHSTHIPTERPLLYLTAPGEPMAGQLQVTICMLLAN